MTEKTEATKRPPLVIPLLIGIILSVLTLVFGWDQTLCAACYDAETGKWILDGSAFGRFLYDYTPVPAFVFFGGGVLVALASLKWDRFKRWARRGIFWALCMLLGPGLVVNGIFKEYYGRPRPKQTVEYGGKMEYRPVWVVGVPRKAKSFPCGHASIGYFFLAGYFLCYHRNRRRAYGWLLFGLLYGSFIGWARMAKGGHWFSDVVWSAVFVYYTCYCSAWISGLHGYRKRKYV